MNHIFWEYKRRKERRPIFMRQRISMKRQEKKKCSHCMNWEGISTSNREKRNLCIEEEYLKKNKI